MIGKPEYVLVDHIYIFEQHNTDPRILDLTANGLGGGVTSAYLPE
jgi:hypothetical protein